MSRFYFLVLAIPISFPVISQETPISNSETQLLEQGKQLFTAGHYESAKDYFFRANESGWSRVFLALIDLKGNDDETATRKILEENWDSEGYFYLKKEYADYLMSGEKYRQVIDLIESLPSEAYTVEEYEGLRFQLGLAYYYQDEYDWAGPVFEEVTLYRGENYHRANYYLGLIKFQKGDKSSSLTYFQEANQTEEFRQHTLPYMAEGFLIEKNYHGLIEFLSESPGSIEDESLRFTTYLYLGEAHFALNNYKDAIENFREAARISLKDIPNPTRYRIGYAYEQEKNYKYAIDYYKEVGRENSSLGQLAAFRLGQIYIKQEEFDYAVNAFDKAGSLQHDQEIREKSLFLKGKILIQQQQYDRAILTFNQYIQTFNDTRNTEEASELLAKAYFNTSDYTKAIDHLEQSGINSRDAKKTYQSVTFKAGLQKFNNEDFSGAVQLFTKSIQYPIDRELAGQGYLLIGECMSIEQNFEEALTYYDRSAQSLSPRSDNFDNLLYGRGYAYFNTNQYERALTDFSALLRISGEGQLKTDATARVGDCYFVQKQYDDAVRFYNRILNTGRGDYATFQLGTIAFLRGNVENAEIFYNRVLSNFPNSIYADNAGFQLGKLFFENENFSKAAEQYSKMIKNSPESILIPRAFLDRGLSYSNHNELAQAHDDFRLILDQYPGHEVAEDALLGMQSLQKKGYDVGDIDQYISKLKTESGDRGKFELIEFEQAKNLYYNQQYDEAIQALEQHIANYPSSEERSEAYYFLGDSYFRKKEWEKAVEKFNNIDKGNLYYTRALDKMGLSYQNAGAYDDASIIYHALKRHAQTPKDSYNALEGLIHSKYYLKQYDSVFFYGEQVLQSGWKPANAEFLVKLYSARSYYQLDQTTRASDLFIELVNSSNERYAAEALFFLGKIQHEKGNFPLSVETLLDLIASYPSYRDWTDKAYLLLVDNYIEMSEFLQAEATLNSIIKNTQNDELREEAKNRLEKISRPSDPEKDGQ